MDENGKSNGVGESKSGIPSGNTIAVVGDPGTGKTTFLLNYLTHGTVTTGKDDKERRCGVVCLQPSDPKQKAVFTALNELFRPARVPRIETKKGKKAKAAAKTHKTVRCFVSLENNLARVLDNHSGLLKSWIDSGELNQFVFVDATAFLSGRLEDKLRYPKLSGIGERPGGDWEDNTHNFTLGGYKLDEDAHFGLYYQVENQEPKRIEQLDKKSIPFLLESDNPTYRAFNLITRPIADPLQRVRLLKDLLAEIFVCFSEKKYEHRLLAIDSLSALMNPFGKNDVSAAASPARRLHMLNLVRWLEEYGVTTFLACEAEPDPGRTWGGQPLFLGTDERYLTSGVIQLNYHDYPSGDIVRYLRVLKMRGAAHDMRPFAYDLDKNGIAWVEPLFGEAGKTV